MQLKLIFTLISFCMMPFWNMHTSYITKNENVPFIWENANVYFLLTDRFYNGDPTNDVNFDRTDKTSVLRGFMGGDIKGITKKIKEGYFSKLGVNAIWLTPVVEQIHGFVDEGQGKTYGFHGYWTKDWTCMDPNFGTEADLQELVKTAHDRGIRILLDVVLNHTGPVTNVDPVWPREWVRTEPRCTYKDYKTTISCTLVNNLPDVKTEDTVSVDLPENLKAKWQKEGRLEKETRELDAFFAKTGLKRTPANYIIKWLTDFIHKYGIDGYRIDTAKHVEENVWTELIKQAQIAFKDWKVAHPEAVLDDNDFYVVGEVYGYNIHNGRDYDFGDRKVDYFSKGFKSLINFGFKYDAKKTYEELFSYYSGRLQNELKGKSVLNYLSSHDDGDPYDLKREKGFEAANRLLLCPGAAQIYYGEESDRPLEREGALGDAHLRTFMNWDQIQKNDTIKRTPIKALLEHWQKLGKFRNEHPAVGAGIHQMISERPYYFSRTYNSEKYRDVVIIGLDLPKGKKKIPINNLFKNGSRLKDYYSGKKVKVRNGKISLDTDYNIVLLGI